MRENQKDFCEFWCWPLGRGEFMQNCPQTIPLPLAGYCTNRLTDEIGIWCPMVESSTRRFPIPFDLSMSASRSMGLLELAEILLPNG